MSRFTRLNQDPAAQTLIQLAREALQRGDSRGTGVVAGLLVSVHVATDDQTVLVRRLVEVMSAAYAANYVAPTVAEEAVDEIAEALGMLSDNVNDDAGAVEMIQNLATLIGAAHRMARVLLQDLSTAQLANIIEENTP